MCFDYLLKYGKRKRISRMGKTFYIIFRIRTSIGAELKIARLEAENKRSAFEILPKAKDPER